MYIYKTFPKAISFQLQLGYKCDSCCFLNDRTSMIGLKDSIVLATCVPVPDPKYLQSSRELYCYEGIYHLRSDRSRTFAFAKHKPRQATRRVDTR
jgi:hypothetical protein